MQESYYLFPTEAWDFHNSLSWDIQIRMEGDRELSIAARAPYEDIYGAYHIRPKNLEHILYFTNADYRTSTILRDVDVRPDGFTWRTTLPPVLYEVPIDFDMEAITGIDVFIDSDAAYGKRTYTVAKQSG